MNNNANLMELSRRNFVKLFGGVSVAAALGLAGCGGSGAGAGSGAAAVEAAKGGTLNIGLSANPVSPNVWVQNDMNSSLIMNLVCPMLMGMDEAGEKFNYLVDDVSSNEDATVWTVKLKELYWNDGTQLTAEDLAFTAQYGTEHKVGFFDSYYGNVASARAVDDLTAEFTLNSTTVHFFNGPGYWIPVMRKSEWESVDDPLNYSDYSGAGYGPFYIDEWVDGQYVHLKRNEHFTQANDGEGAWVDEVMFHVYTDENALVLALQNGEVDMCANFLTASSKSQVEGDERFLITDVPSLGYAQLAFSQRCELLQNTNIRIALSMLIDREALCAVGMSGGAVPMPGPISPVYEEFNEAGIEEPAYDVDGAIELLESEGFTEVGDDGIRANADGVRLSFTLRYKSSTGQVDSVVEMLRSQAEEAGVEYKLEVLDASTYSALVTNGHDYEVSFSSWGTIDDVDTTLYTIYGIGQTLNDMEYNNEEMDNLLVQMKSTIDDAERKELLDQWQQLFVENMPLATLYVPTQSFAASTEKFAGYSTTLGYYGYTGCPQLCGIYTTESSE